MAYPKIQYFKTPPGLIPGVNLLASPRQFSDAVWSKSASPLATATADTQLAPDGTMTADTLNFAPLAGGVVSRIEQTVAMVTQNLPFAFSIWLKATAPVNINLQIDDAVSQNAAVALIGVTTAWQQYEISGTFSGTSAAFARAVIFNADPLSSIALYAWDAVLKCGTAMELLFKLPPINKPYVWQEAQRHDIFASGGEKQTTVERIDQFIAIEMPAIFGGDDADAWQDFLTWSIEGGEFQYFPDSDLDDSITCTVEETTAKPERKSRDVYSVKLTFRVAVP